MATTPPAAPAQIGILILDDDPATQGALRQILDAEGWRVRFVPDGRALLAELATGEWSLVIASIALTGLDSSAFLTMKELSSTPVEEGGRVRVLFLIPEFGGGAFATALDQLHMPYVARPFHLHDFLDKVSDLLVEIKAINAPIRQVRYEFGELHKVKKKGERDTSMFASRDSSVYTEEELAEYEKQEQESSTQRKKRQKPLTDLGRPLR
jgi:DNA-binding response OmpR family regulator